MQTNFNTRVLPYGDQIWAIDLHEGHLPGRTSGYLIKGDRNVLIDTGSSICHPYLLDGLSQLGIKFADLDYVIVTHIHLDHSGGVGKLLPLLPNATVVVHPRGARHLADPSRLIVGARAAWGDQLEELFGEILPVPQDRLLVRADGETLEIDSGRTLQFLDTPGHAKHHFSIWDPASQGLFCGDTFGIRYIPEATGWNFEALFPSTSPSEFDPDAVIDSIRKAEKLQPKYLFHSHFGRSDQPVDVFHAMARMVRDFDQIGKRLYQPDLSWTSLAEQLRTYVRNELKIAGHSELLVLDGLEIDLELNAKGILHRWQLKDDRR
ncbi:MAG: fold metallo-hydrolase [Bacilli bacterium]|nr:fold metallo-hydrolase [Bacilli bacterium]